MPKEMYHSHEIVYSEAQPGKDRSEAAARSATPSLQIDGQDYQVVVHSDGTYSAHEFYFDKFGSLPALGRALARNLPDRSDADR